MVSSHTVLLLLLLALIAIVGSTNGEPGCDNSPTRADMYDEDAQRNLDNADKFGRMNLDCETTGESSSETSGFYSGSERIIDISVGVFFLFCVAMAIWLSFIRRRNAMKAAAIRPYTPGEMEGQEMGGKQKSFTMNAPTGKLPKSDTNV